MKKSTLAVFAALLGIACAAPEDSAPTSYPTGVALRVPITAPDAETAARRVLAAPSDLRVSSIRESLTGEHVRFRQLADDGSPVMGVETSVHFTGSAPSYVLRMVRSNAVRPLRLTGRRSLAESAARKSAARSVDILHPARAASVLASAAMVRPVAAHEGRPGWRVVVSTSEPYHEWEVWVDGETGAAEILRDLLIHVDGEGYVYRPNPLTQTADETMADNNDADSQALTDARRLVTLQGLDGSGNLSGDYCDAHVKNGQRANESSLQFDYTRSSSWFGEVNAYYHVDHANRNLQSLGFTGSKAIADFPIEVIIDGTNQDNSWYSPTSNDITLGKGGVDDSEDGDIVVHEYGHAVAEDIVHNFGSSTEAAGMGEGFSDILATSTPTNDDDAITRACVAPWDALSYGEPDPIFPCLRRVDGQKHYPEHLLGWSHDDGELWSGAIWDMYARTGLGPSAGLQLVAESIFSLAANASFRDSADAILMADEDLNGGANATAIERAFIWHGLFDTITPEADFPPPTSSHAYALESPHPLADFDDSMETITHPGATAIRVHFVSMNMQTGAGCADNQCDNVYIYDSAGLLYGKLGGAQNDFYSPVVPGDSITVRWVSDGSGDSQGIVIDSYETSVTELPDAAPVPDATPVPDAMPLPDAMPTPDAEPLPDAASTPDASPPVDSGPTADAAGGETDAAPSDDAGSTDVDAGPTADATPGPDSPSAADAGPTGDESSDCGCRSGNVDRRSHLGTAFLFALVALMLGRPRRRRRRGARR